MSGFINDLYNGSVFTSSSLSPLILVPLSLLQLVMCFMLMGILSSEFLANNINSLCNSSGILITILLSFCNSSPDIISNFVAWTASDVEASNTDSLAFSEVLGSCGTIICVAVGLILIAIGKLTKKISSPLNNVDQDQQELVLERQDVLEIECAEEERQCEIEFKSIVRKLLVDLAFFWIAMVMIQICVFTSSISVFSCFTMISIYITYLYTNYKQHKNLKKKGTRVESIPAVDIQLDDFNYQAQVDNEQEENLVRLNYTHPNFLENIDYSYFLDVLEHSDQELKFQKSNNSLSVEMDSNDKNIAQRPYSAPNRTGYFETSIDSNVYANSEPLDFKPYSDLEQQNNPLEDQSELRPESPIVIQKINSPKINHSRKQRIKLKVQNYWEKFQGKPIYEKAIIILNTPILGLIILSSPKLEKSLPFTKSRSLVLLAQCILSPLFTVFSISRFISGGDYNLRLTLFISFPLILVLIILQLHMSNQIKNHYKLSLYAPTPPIVKVNNQNSETSNDKKQSIEEEINWQKDFKMILKYFAILGIFNSIIWIVILANNLIGIIQYYQKLTKISESILGLTFFAWGNSIADILSNLAILKLYDTKKNSLNSLIKFSAISIGSCIGGCLINSMIGVGLNCFIAIMSTESTNNKRSKWEFNNISYKTFLHLCVSSTVIFGTVSVFIFLLLMVSVSKKPVPTRHICTTYLDKLGVVLISIWGLTTFANVLIELFVS